MTLRTVFAAVALWLAASVGAAAQTTPATPPTPTAASANSTSNGSSGGPSSVQDPTKAARLNDGVTLPVYGSQLFTGAFSATRPAQSTNYVVQVGDQIDVRFYGATNQDSTTAVDASGALFVTGVGPVKVAGVPITQLQARVAAAVSAVYNNSVGVYVNVIQGGVLGVFVTGDVVRPGRYQGSTTDNILYFLDQAGGVDARKGSMRDVTIRREGRIVAQYDIYDFLTKGYIAPFKFEDGDVVFVGPRGTVVGVTGDAGNIFAFEAPRGQKSFSGAELLDLARASSNATTVGLTTVVGSSRNAATFSIAQFAKAKLINGDHIDVRSEIYTEQITVSISGDLRGARSFVLPRDAKLSQLLAQVPLQGSDIEQRYIHIQRASVAAQQKNALDKALTDLEKAAITAPQQSQNGGSSFAAVQQFITAAQAVQPPGTVAVYSNDRFNDITLETGDVVIFPRKSDVVVVAGEVLTPGAFAHSRRMKVKDYIRRAGGFAQTADRHHFILSRPDGSALVVRGNAVPRPGDQIVVAPDFGPSLMDQVREVLGVVLQGVTTATVLGKAIR